MHHSIDGGLQEPIHIHGAVICAYLKHFGLLYGGADLCKI